MASDRGSTAPLIDLAAIIVSPVLVMLMVGSLVFFLIEVVYGHDDVASSRLQYTMFFFVPGAVLIARIAIEFGRARAGLYAAGLGLACFLAMMLYVRYETPLLRALGPLINLGLIALVWWSANKLTWDCTHFEEDRRASGRGVLAAAGLDDAATDSAEEEDEPPATAKKKKGKPPEGFLGWVERFRAYRQAQRKKAHTPGVWVLYFALAALPLFALGQSLISPDDADRRRATFFHMAIYIGSALGLLVTTTLFGLKRYLEQRNARIPPVMTAAWLGLGGALIVLFLALGAALPRPHSETAWFGLKRPPKSDREASKYAVVRDGAAGKGEGAEGTKTEAGKGKGSARGGEKGGGSSGEKGAGGGKGDSQGGKQQSGNDSGNQAGEKGGPGGDRAATRNESRSKSQPGRDRKSDSRSDASSATKGEGSDESSDGEETSEANDTDSGRSGSASSAAPRLTQALESIGSFVKWIVWILVAVGVVVGLALFFLKWLAPFTNWARNLLDWLRGLFGPKAPRERSEDEQGTVTAGVDRPPPFAAFSNPFTAGIARGRDLAELVEYTFAAFEAWAWDQGRGRAPEETPLEFAVRIGHEYADLDEPGYQTAQLYVRVLYSRGSLPPDAAKTLEALWDQLESAPRPTLTA